MAYKDVRQKPANLALFGGHNDHDGANDVPRFTLNTKFYEILYFFKRGKRVQTGLQS